jgi:NAD+ synthase (glutamine-hydrolysing)
MIEPLAEIRAGDFSDATNFSELCTIMERRCAILQVQNIENLTKMQKHTKGSFFNLYTHDFARVAVAVPRCQIADPVFNAKETLKLAGQAFDKGATLVAFPELGLAAYTSDDLFHQRALLDGCEAALSTIVEASRSLPVTMIVGAPLRVDHKLFNCAVVVSQGEIRGVVPKSYLPNYGEFYEARQFAAAEGTSVRQISLLGQNVPFGTGQLFQFSNLPLFRFHVEICEDVWVPVPPSSFATLAGATVLVNLSASNGLVGKAAYRHNLVGQQSARCVAAYLYASSGPGESSNDLAWDGHGFVYENGELLAESERYSDKSQLIFADIDLEKLSRERMRQTTFAQTARNLAAQVSLFQTVSFPGHIPVQDSLALERKVERFPYVPANSALRDERCEEVFNIQVQALTQRMSASGITKLVIGVSGGLDSTHALLVCAKAMDKLGLPRSNIQGVTMPGFATSGRTLAQAKRLMEVVGCTASEVDIRPSCLQMLKDLDHPYARGEAKYDITFENVQAGERTNHLFRIANFKGGFVIGTGDLSEAAQGYCTYGVGDHMSHYNVNGSVPKTLISHMVRWVSETGQIGQSGSEVLDAILGTEISPELVPGSDKNAPEQKSENNVGPYELQDFNLYYVLRFGYAPSKVAFLSHTAWHDASKGEWPEGLPTHNAYELGVIKKNLGNFVDRFFRTSQFKRTCVPNGPKVGSGGSLSPRGDWRAPSDAQSTVWMADLDNIPA